MNLYKVFPRNEGWYCYVFAETRNQAKTMTANYFDRDEIGLTARISRKNTGGKAEVCALNNKRMQALGVKYENEVIE